MPTPEVTVGVVLGILGILVAVGAWVWPRTRSRRKSHERLRVSVSNHFPVFDRPDGSKEFGDDLIGVTVSNGTERAVKATNWGVHLPGNRNMVQFVPATTWEPRMPHWVQPGDEATWYLKTDVVRSEAARLAFKFKDMRAYVSFADGREVKADRGIPLA